ncbi:MAG TPA: site-2 protease family protein [Bryobacteraceae bacterium]|nr:site-2 protease family protein [Bryobacteraceae bacterium]
MDVYNALPPPPQHRVRWGVHIALLFLTLLTTSAMGARLADNFAANRPLVATDLLAVTQIFVDPGALIRGLPFSLTLLTILLAHEMGHYVACLYYRIDASLPWFLPSPLLLGTFGAFIRIRSAICSKRALFDVGVAGPIAGFVLVVPALAIGLAHSKMIPAIAAQGDLLFGTPLLQHLLQMAIMPGVPASDILLHPVARAAWIGALATALNLLPIGQLDGGHILYAFVGRWHTRLSRLFAAALIPLGYYYWHGWFFWGVILFFLNRHPRIYDETPIGRARGKLGALAVTMLVLCFTVTPIHP